MGVRKKLAAERRKEERKSTYIATLKDCPTSPRKMRIVADLIRGMEVEKAAAVLQFSKKEASRGLEKLLRSAIANYEQKTESDAEGAGLFVKEIRVDGARMLKRIQPAPQGRAHRIRKRSNHVTLILDTKTQTQETEAVQADNEE